MDLAIGIATLALQALLAFVGTIGYAWAVALCLLGCLFAIHLYIAQPSDDKSEVGPSSRLVAFGMGAPIFLLCAGLMVWLFTLGAAA